jgi:RimJ/RimL family protein N-acetyltransferase
MPVIITDRLILRPPEAADFEDWADVMGDDIASRYIGGPLTRGQAWRSLATMAGSWALYGYGNFSVLEKSTGCWVGRAGPWHPDPWPGPEVGWVFRRDVWGRGYATEAAWATVDWLTVACGWRRMVHVIHPENAASMAVARRLGSVEIFDADVSMFDEPKPRVFGRSLDDWPAGQAPNGRAPA